MNPVRNPIAMESENKISNGVKKTNRAVTLIELLIASSIFVVVMITIYSAFHTGLFGYSDIEDSIDIYQTARLLLERLNLDLRNHFAYSSDETKFSGNNTEINFLTLTDNVSQGKLMHNYSFISYKLDGKSLLRLCRSNQEALNDKSQTQAQELASNIESLSFSFAFFDPASQELKWKDSWDEKTLFPVAVKAKLIISGKTKQEFARTIYLP